MTAAILSIGTELTRGQIVNGNAAWLAAELTGIGFEVQEVATIDDHVERIGAALERLSSHAVVVATGGLGPTTDDMTAWSVAQALGVPLERDASCLDAIRRRFEAMGRTMSPSNEKQADLPRGADALPNPVGTAPGFAVHVGRAHAFFLPGVPHEMERMFSDQVAPRISKLAPNLTYEVRLKTFGLPESVVGEKLAGIEQAFPGVTIGYRAHFPEIEVKLLATAASQAEARAVAGRAADETRARLGSAVYGEGSDTFPQVVARALKARGMMLALAESCTGGLVGHLLTRAPASDYFIADAVTYANSAKTRLLGVSEDMLRGHGAVSPEVAAAMAEGVRRITGADIGMSITGVAGPSGGTPDKPLGLVYWAVAHAGGTVVQDRVFAGERIRIQTLAAYNAMALVRDVCLGKVA
jgi:nicotinamide-nucleotide amidase